MMMTFFWLGYDILIKQTKIMKVIQRLCTNDRSDNKKLQPL